MIKDIGKLRYLLSRRDRRILWGLVVFSILVSLLEMVGVSAIMPFVAVAVDFDKIQETWYFRTVYEAFHFSSPVHFVTAFGVVLIVFYIFRSLINLVYFYALARFSQGRYHRIAYRLFENYIGMSYRAFLDKNSSQMMKSIINEAQNVVEILSFALFMLSEIFVTLLIYGMLLFVNWKMTLLLTLFLGVNVALIKWTVSPRIKQAGQERARFQERFYEILSSTFGNFKIIKLKSNDKEILDRFREASWGYVRSNIKNQALAQFPRLFLEAIGFSLIAVVVIYLVLKYQTDIRAALPLLSVFILGLYRLMPSINRILNSYNDILFRLEALKIVHNELIYEPEDLGDEAIGFHHAIHLENVGFEYVEGKTVLRNVDLTVRKGERIGIVGESGSGKSTLVDIIAGLYRPSQGRVLIDDVELSESNVKSWRRKIGYIPQSIYLFDGTVAQNVAFGETIDEERVKEALDRANILDFLETHFEGIHTRVGEGGIKLSGGQKQRIAIARALYADPEVLILDEATSALDTETEAKIMDEIYRASENRTLLIVAHRLSTLSGCDIIYRVENGKLLFNSLENKKYIMK